MPAPRIFCWFCGSDRSDEPIWSALPTSKAFICVACVYHFHRLAAEGAPLGEQQLGRIKSTKVSHGIIEGPQGDVWFHRFHLEPRTPLGKRQELPSRGDWVLFTAEQDRQDSFNFRATRVERLDGEPGVTARLEGTRNPSDTATPD